MMNGSRDWGLELTWGMDGLIGIIYFFAVLIVMGFVVLVVRH